MPFLYMGMQSGCVCNTDGLCMLRTVACMQLHAQVLTMSDSAAFVRCCLIIPLGTIKHKVQSKIAAWQPACCAHHFLGDFGFQNCP